eukprot:CFRG4433T1
MASNSGYARIDVGEPSYDASDAQNDDVIQINRYETSLSLSVAAEASLCYALGPITGFLFLVLEIKNDYVRFHAWQSSLMFGTTAILHLLLFWSSFLSWTLVLVEVAAILYMARLAYQCAEELVRVEVLHFGYLASKWVNEENE